jgi:hypothetical protein
LSTVPKNLNFILYMMRTLKHCQQGDNDQRDNVDTV